MPAIAKIGDVFAISLTEGRVAYAHYVYRHPEIGALVAVKSIIDDGRSSVETVISAANAFPPIFVGLNFPIRQRLWRRIGTGPVGEFTFPRFRKSITAAIGGYAPGVYGDWRLWDGLSYEIIGFLPAEFLSLECEAVWPSDLVEKRIATGENMFDLVK